MNEQEQRRADCLELLEKMAEDIKALDLTAEEGPQLLRFVHVTLERAARSLGIERNDTD